MHGYLADVQKLEMPAWADAKRIEDTIEMFMQHGLSAYMVLTCSSLPECYISRDIARVLSITQRLNEDGHRRLVETSQFVLKIMTPGGLTSAEGEGLLVVHKIRLIHATVRHLIHRQDQQQHRDHAQHDIDQRDFGYQIAAGSYSDRSPISQADLALTLQTFGYVILRGMKTVGVELTDQQRDDFIHTWSVIGHFLGIRDELLPSNFEDARALFELIKQRQRAATPEGKELLASLVKFTGKMLPWFLRRIPRKMVADLMSEEDCVALGMKRPGWFGKLIDLLPLLFIRRRNRQYRSIAWCLPSAPDVWEFVARRLLEGISSLPPSEQMRIYSLPERAHQKPAGPSQRRVADSA